MREQFAGTRSCVVGSYVADIIMKLPRLPQLGETLVGESLYIGPGGKGANQAVMARRLGGAVTMVGKVGRDPLGEMLLAAMRREGVDTSQTGRAEGASGAATVLVDPEGRNAAAVALGANLALTPNDVERARRAIESAHVVLCQNEIPIRTTEAALRAARAVGARTLWNPAPGFGVPTELLALADVLVVNEAETELLADMPVRDDADVESAADLLRQHGAEIVVITLGERGAYLRTPDRGMCFPAHHVRAVDATGAGDAFVGTLAVALAAGQSAERAVRLANVAGALATTCLGTQAAFPTLDEVLSAEC